jgi:hypothetical protein
MSTARPRQIVDDTISRADLVISIVIIEGGPAVRIYGIGQYARLRIDERRTVDENLGFIQQVSREKMLESNEIIPWVIDRPYSVQHDCVAIGCVD